MMNFTITKTGDKFTAKLNDFDLSAEGETLLLSFMHLIETMAYSGYENTIAVITSEEFR